jgi:hypothetical protein
VLIGAGGLAFGLLIARTGKPSSRVTTRAPDSTTSAVEPETTVDLQALIPPPPPSAPVETLPGASSTELPSSTTSTLPAGPDPRGLVQFEFTSVNCDGNALLVVGAASNRGNRPYSLQFTVTVTAPDGSVRGTAPGSVSGLAPGQQQPFSATGTCAGPLGPGDRAQARVDAIG